MRLASIVLCFIIITSCANNQESKKESLPTPIIDGDNSEFMTLGAEKVSIDDIISIYFYQDQHHVWISYDYPEGSYGTLDLVIDSPKLETPMNLHVSAQLGEWPANQPDLAPQVANSDKWWNTDQWTANTVWFNGFKDNVDSTAQRQLNFKNGNARELQLSKARFGKGDWKLSFDIRAIKVATDSMKAYSFPEKNKGPYILNAW